MKKICLLLALMMVGSALTFAGSLRILNLSPCSYHVYTYAGEGEVYAYGFYDMTFADPSTVPGSTAPATASFVYATIRRDNFPDAFSVGSAPAPSYFNSADINDYPDCKSGGTYDAYWTVLNQVTGDVLLLIN